MSKRFRDEYAGAALGDSRRSERLAELGMALAAYPGASFPEALGDSASLEAAYRFLSNEAVEPGEVLEPHYRESVARCEERRAPVIVAHDSSDFVFAGEHRRGLGRMRGSKERGFWSHFAMAVSWDAWREPLGVLHVELWTRSGEVRTSAKKAPRERHRDANRESKRWSRGVEAVEMSCDGAVHVMDREADDYELLAEMVQKHRRFIVRSKANRRVADTGHLADAVSLGEVLVTREVPLSTRRQPTFPKQKKIHPRRAGRIAKLQVKATAVTLLCPHGLVGEMPDELTVHVVAVEEPSPPAGEPPVSWRLLTTEPIATAEELERIVDGYRCRWRIEEFFKALKTGCAIEKRQLESYHSLVNALAIYVPIAWRILRHRSMAHEDAERPASAILTKLQIQLLRVKGRTKLARSPTASAALTAVAALGGHLKRNGPPGWQTLARGYERLLTLEEGALALAKM